MPIRSIQNAENPDPFASRTLGARSPDPLSDAFVEGFQELGVASTPDYNVVSYEGVRYLEQTAHKGRTLVHCRRLSAGCRESGPNFEIRTGVRVTRVLFEGKRATGVEYLHNSRKVTVKADGEVLLSAGANPVSAHTGAFGHRQPGAPERNRASGRAEFA